MKQPKKPTPLEILLADKERIRQQCRQQEQKLNESFSFVNENAGSLLLSSVSSLLFSGSGRTAKKDKTLPASQRQPVVDLPTVSIGLSDCLSIGKAMIPVIWEIAKPVIMAWGIKKVKKIISQVFKGSKLKV